MDWSQLSDQIGGIWSRGKKGYVGNPQSTPASVSVSAPRPRAKRGDSSSTFSTSTNPQVERFVPEVEEFLKQLGGDDVESMKYVLLAFQKTLRDKGLRVLFTKLPT